MLGRARAVDAGVVGGIADVAEIDEEREAPAEEKLTLEIEEELFGPPRVRAGLDTASRERGLAVEAAVVPVGAEIEFRAGEAEAPVVGAGDEAGEVSGVVAGGAEGAGVGEDLQASRPRG